MLPGDFHLPKPSTKKILALGVLSLSGLVGSLVGLALLVFGASAWFGLPLNVFGVRDGPEQPIAFPHTVHVQELGLDCTFCHRNVTIGAAATIPAVGLCMTCHIVVGDDNDEVKKLRDFHASGTPIDWVRVHRVPDHVHFVHEAHIRFFSGLKTVVKDIDDPQSQIKLRDAKEIDPSVTVGQTIDVAASATCSTCHGDVGSMTKVMQIRSLKMSDCVDCHRDNSAPTDCTTCHY